MIEVYVNGISDERRALVSHANACQEFYHFTGEAGPPFEVVLTNVQHPQLFHIANRDKVFISTWNVEGICLYAQRRPLDYFLLCSLLGLAQLRALTNCTLIPEDFIHAEPKECLFAQHTTRSEIAVKLQHPHVCAGCVAFYRALNVHEEFDVVALAIARMETRPAAKPAHVTNTPNRTQA